MKTKKVTVTSKIKQPAMPRKYMNHVSKDHASYLFYNDLELASNHSLLGSLVAQG